MGFELYKFDVFTANLLQHFSLVTPVGCVMDDSPNAPQISGGALRWRDNAPYKTRFGVIKSVVYTP
ncbi:hypothetical protein NIES25_27410 [Nostoc linckia NIES-25]|nr:hypothetical protein NIES25_27410 [Nostoc linckia NIES-25]